MNLDRNRIVLIKPITGEPRLSFLSIQPPINLAYLAATLQRAGFDVEIWDYAVSAYNPDDFGERLLRSLPALVGITCMTPTILYGYDIAQTVKKFLPDAVVSIGGPHSTALPQRTLEECPSLDAVVVGEGEITFLDLAERVRDNKPLSGCSGLVHRQNGQVITEAPRPLIPSLDDLPYPARDLLDSDLYRSVQHTRGLSPAHSPLTEIFTSRGCPGKCLFCAVNIGCGPHVRFRSVENVLGEVEECQRRHGIRHFVIQDDTFNLRPSRVAELMQGFRRLGVQSFSCDARVDTMSR
ncbi:MAG: radical SAM protein, partial [bacterium]